MKRLNSTGPSTDPWGSPLVTGLQLDFVPWITTLQAQPFSQFSVPLTATYQFTCEDIMGALLKSKQTTSTHFSALIHLVSHLIFEVYQVGEASNYSQSQ